MTHLEFKQLGEMSAREAFELFKLRAGCARVFPTPEGPRFGRFVGRALRPWRRGAARGDARAS